MKIVMIGAGNVATHLFHALEKNNTIIQVYSRNITNAEVLTSGLVPATDNLGSIDSNADAYIISVKDDAVESIIDTLSEVNPKALWLHTSGSKGIDVFLGKMHNYGVLYPLQTFSKNVDINMHEVPFFIEGNNTEVEKEIEQLAHDISDNVYPADSEKRKSMHMAAVFACNFTNHLWTLSKEILDDTNIPFSVLFPLIRATEKKIEQVEPNDAQTGPAARGDKHIINNHLENLEGIKKEIYQIISESILIHNKKK